MCNAEGAGHYLSTFKQYEHKPPDFIKERADKDYASVLQTALTSVNRVNKTDVETLHTSFGVRPQKPNIFYRILIANLSRNEINPEFCRHCKATPNQLQSLPGFGQVKVKRMKD